jgi:hypothetical protein
MDLAMMSMIVEVWGGRRSRFKRHQPRPQPIRWRSHLLLVVPRIFGDVAVPESAERIITLTDGALDAVIS